MAPRSKRKPIQAELVDRALPDLPSSSHGRTCSFCGGPLDPDDRFCPHCGGHQSDAAGSTGSAVTASRAATAERAEATVPPAPPAVQRSDELGEVPVDELGEAEPEVDPVVQWTSERQVTGGAEATALQCRNCGSQFTAGQAGLSYQCPFCQANYVVEPAPESSRRREADFIIGFAISPQQAHEKFLQWISSNSWFRPGDLRHAFPAEKFRGVYIPFWTFSMLAQSHWSARIGEYWYRTETYQVRGPDGKMQTRVRTVRETEWWPLRGRHHSYYHGYLVSASHGLSQAEADSVKPFQLAALRRYEPMYLAGWLSEQYTIDHDEAFERCQHVFLQNEHNAVSQFLPGDEFRGLDVRTTFSHINGDLCLLPVYIMNYLYRGKPFRFIVNGQTGKVAGEKPVSAARVWGAAGVAIALLIALLLLIFALGA